MKKSMCCLLLCVAFSVTAVFASPQQPQDKPRPFAPESPSLAQRLALSNEQKAEFRAINKERKMQLDAVQADPSLTPRARRQKTKEIHAVAETKLRAVLNQDQLEEYDQIKRERQQRRTMQRDTNTPAPQATPPPQ